MAQSRVGEKIPNPRTDRSVRERGSGNALSLSLSHTHAHLKMLKQTNTTRWLLMDG
jgi:hypothetical protein